MAAFASTQLSGVAPNGRRVVSAENLERTHAEVISRGDDSGGGYALGWNTEASYLGMRALWHDGDGQGVTAEVLLLPDADLGVVVLTNRVVAQPFFRAVEQFAAETVLGREHTGDESLVAADEGTLSYLRDLAAQTSVVSREQAEPYLGNYSDEVRVTFDDRGFVLRTEFGTLPLVSLGAPGLFTVGGVMNGRVSVAFEGDADSMQLVLELLVKEGTAQPFALQRWND